MPRTPKRPPRRRKAEPELVTRRITPEERARGWFMHNGVRKTINVGMDVFKYFRPVAPKK